MVELISKYTELDPAIQENDELVGGEIWVINDNGMKKQVRVDCVPGNVNCSARKLNRCLATSGSQIPYNIVCGQYFGISSTIEELRTNLP